MIRNVTEISQLAFYEQFNSVSSYVVSSLVLSISFSSSLSLSLFLHTRLHPYLLVLVCRRTGRRQP